MFSPFRFALVSCLVFIAIFLGGATVLRADFGGSTEIVPIDEMGGFVYSSMEIRGPIERLQERLDNGSSSLKWNDKNGYLTALTEHLQLLKSSQALVFSNSSSQREHISPQNPRALYFNDDTYLGYIPGAPLLEISVADPKLGAVFYILEQTKTQKPRLVRNNNCLECHVSGRGMGVPGHVVRSFQTNKDGNVDFRTGSTFITHRTPLAQRWGGWYVTGDAGKQPHLGNLIGQKAFAEHEKNPLSQANLKDLNGRFDTSRYFAPQSDIVSLMVLEHQTHGHNFLTRLNYEATTKIARYGAAKYLDDPTESFLKYLLMTEEAPLSAPIVGSSSFTKDWSAQGPKDKRERSLRDFDLQTRLFKYRCSYLIYSSAFDALPPLLKEKIYARLWEILSGADKSPAFAMISADERRAILEILLETKPNLPDNWKLPNG